MYASSRVGHCVKNYCLHVSWKQIPKENQCIELRRTISRKKSIPLRNIISYATDDVPSMVDRRRGFLSYLKKAVPKVLTDHCVIHRQHFVAKNLSEKLHESLSTVITAVNKIKANALNSRLFHQLCIENDEDFLCLFLHAEVWWLSKGNCLKRFYTLFNSVLDFFKNSTLSFTTNWNRVRQILPVWPIFSWNPWLGDRSVYWTQHRGANPSRRGTCKFAKWGSETNVQNLLPSLFDANSDPKTLPNPVERHQVVFHCFFDFLPGWEGIQRCVQAPL